MNASLPIIFDWFYAQYIVWTGTYYVLYLLLPPVRRNIHFGIVIEKAHVCTLDPFFFEFIRCQGLIDVICIVNTENTDTAWGFSTDQIKPCRFRSFYAHLKRSFEFNVPQHHRKSLIVICVSPKHIFDNNDLDMKNRSEDRTMNYTRNRMGKRLKSFRWKCVWVGARGFEPLSAGFHHVGSYPTRNYESSLQLFINCQQTHFKSRSITGARQSARLAYTPGKLKWSGLLLTHLLCSLSSSHLFLAPFPTLVTAFLPGAWTSLHDVSFLEW